MKLPDILLSILAVTGTIVFVIMGTLLIVMTWRVVFQ